MRPRFSGPALFGMVAAIAVPTVAAVALGGPRLGILAAVLAAGTVAFLAIRARPRGPIERPGAPAGGHRVLVVGDCSLAEEGIGRRIADHVKDRGSSEVRMVAPIDVSWLERWASDTDAATREARKCLDDVTSFLAGLGIQARGEVADEDPVQAAADALRGFAADEVLVVAARDADGGWQRLSGEIGERARVPVTSLG